MSLTTPISAIPMELLECSMSNWVHVLADPLSDELVQAKCHHCETVLECRRIVAPFVACAPCIARKKEEDAEARHREYWEKICPEQFRKTITHFDGFPEELLEQLEKKDPARSLFLYGPTGTCKTRVAMLLVKRALFRDKRVGILWPERLAGLRSSFDTVTFDRYAAYDFLLMDDILLTAVREPKLLDVVKQLIDIRMRHERPFIITSQIGSEADLTTGKEFGDAKAADIERVKALIRRINDTCDVVNFAKKEGTF